MIPFSLISYGENNTLGGFSVLKSGETVNLIKINHYKKFIFAQGLLFQSSANTIIISKKRIFFSMHVPYYCSNMCIPPGPSESKSVV